MTSNVFVNRTLNMKKIKYIGLDMDHTLIRYQTKRFEELVYKLTIEHLIQALHYPEAIKSLIFEFDNAIRGSVVDSKNGNILKLSRYAAIRQSQHGTKHIQFNQQQEIYRSTYVDLGSPNYIAIDTAFSISFCVLYGQLVDFKDEHPELLPSYQVIANDVLNAVDEVHANGYLKNHISQNLDEFVIREPQVIEGLKHYIKLKKKIFVLTNSDYNYTKLLLDYAINPFLGPNEAWQDLFEFVITLSNKPRFFYDNLCFLSVNPKTGCLSNYRGKIVPGLYQGGNATKFTDDLGLKGDEILYIGDHIYGDILRLKKDCNWRTALVVEELGAEIAAQKKAQPIEDKIVAAMKIKEELEEQCITLQTKQLLEAEHTNHELLNELQVKIVELDNKIAQLLKQQRTFFNKNWGRMFRAGAEESFFAYQVDRYACIYMEKLSDLLAKSPLTYFRASRRRLSHDSE